MADGIRKCATIVTLISPYYDVARGTGIITINSPGGSTLKCGMWLCSPSGSTLLCGRWLWHDIEFAQTSAILEFYFWFRF